MPVVGPTEFGHIFVDGKKYEHDVIIDYTGRVEKGWLKTRHLVDKEEFKQLSKSNPEVILIGNGQYGDCEVSDEFVELAESKGIEVIIKETKEAVEKFNELVKNGKKVVAYMHVTC
jgi:hypothetical protein